MKSGTSFFVGFIVGAIATFGILFIYTKRQSSEGKTNDSIMMFNAPGEVIEYSILDEKITTYKVIQVLPNGAALACPAALGITIPDQVVLFPPLKDGSYYDSQVIKTPKKHIAKMAGVYRYETKDGGQKTVPVVKFYPI